MTKLRSDSAWAGITVEQRAKLESWLFEKNLGHRQTLELATKEFGIRASLTSLKMFSRRLAEERHCRQATETFAARVYPGEKGGATLEQLRTIGETLTALRACQLAMESPGKLYELAALCRTVTRQQKASMERNKLDRLREIEVKQSTVNPGGFPHKSA